MKARHMTPSPGKANPAPGKAYPAPGHRVYNFSAGPATLPLSVLEKAREALLDFQGLGASVVEVSHRTPEFLALIEESLALLRELLAVPENYRILLLHGGGQLQFSMVPFNLIAYRPARKALYTDTGLFASRAVEIAVRYGYVSVPWHSRETDYDRVPEIDPAEVDPEASYLHITSNNTVMGTCWDTFPDTGGVPLVADMTSEILSRTLDLRQFGLIYAGAQKNLAPAGLSMAIIREDLLGHALPETPKLMNYAVFAEDRHSMANTPSSFSVFMLRQMMDWVKEQGGVAALEQRNRDKAAILYRILDESAFYRGFALPEHRAIMNVTFGLPDAGLLKRFLAEADGEGLMSLAGHHARGAVRASIYNAMPVEGVQALADFMTEFERRHG
jgi:phosphoserine aminotransferase